MAHDQNGSDICAACGGSVGDSVRVRLGDARLVSCRLCSSWNYFPRPSPEEQKDIHDNPDYWEHPYFKDRREVQATVDRRCRNMLAEIGKQIELESLRGQRLLDIGCDTGEFLVSAARQAGITPVGIDVSARAIEETEKKGIEAYQCDLENAPEYLKDLKIITAVDLIEHLVDPRQFLDQLKTRLSPGGLLYLETPNIRSVFYKIGILICRLTENRPRLITERLFQPQHVIYFTEKGLSLLARRCGMEVVKIFKRTLPWSDLAFPFLMKLGITGAQLFDLVSREKILICALLRKPL